MPTTLQLATPRLLLRPWRDEDRAPFASMNADPEVMRFFPALMSREESDEAIDRYNLQLTRDGFTMFAAQHLPTGQLAGILGLQTMRFAIPNVSQPAVEIGWRLARPFHGQGLATEAARALLAHAFTTLNLPRVVSITTPANAPSRHVMEKIGLLHQPALTFEHPRVPEGHPHRTHVLYQLTR